MATENGNEWWRSCCDIHHGLWCKGAHSPECPRAVETDSDPCRTASGRRWTRRSPTIAAGSELRSLRPSATRDLSSRPPRRRSLDAGRGGRLPGLERGLGRATRRARRHGLERSLRLPQGDRPRGGRTRDPARRLRARRLPPHRRDRAFLCDRARHRTACARWAPGARNLQRLPDPRGDGPSSWRSHTQRTSAVRVPRRLGEDRRRGTLHAETRG